MNESSQRARVAAASLVAAVMAGSAVAQTPSPASRAIEYRKAVYRVMAGNFAPLAQIGQGKAEFDATLAATNSARLSQIAAFAADAFPVHSREGDTRAQSTVWSDAAAFRRMTDEFIEKTRKLAQIGATSSSASPEFKAAVSAVGNGCKNCHERFRSQ
jgi:cytochrome c556